MNLFDKTGTNIIFEMPPAGRIRINSVQCATKETGAGTKSPDNPFVLTGTTKLTVNGTDYAIPTGWSLPNGVADIRNVISGVGTNNVGKVILNGSQNLNVGMYNANTVRFYTIDLYSLTGLSSDTVNVLSDKFIGETWNNRNLDKELVTTYPTTGRIDISVLKSRLTGWLDAWTEFQKVAALKTWLSTNPVTVLYQLATPQTVQGSPIAPFAWPYNQAAVSVDAGTINLSVFNNWTAPKTDWTTSDYFNLDPDYNRIKANILFLKEYSERMYSVFSLLDMSDFTIDDIPFDTFLNNIVDNVTRLETNLYKPPAAQSMKMYTGGLLGWNASELNVIESNILQLFNAITGQWNCIPQMAFTMGVDEL